MANYIPKSAFVKAPKKVINNIETNIMMNIAGIAANASFTSIQTMLVNFISTSLTTIFCFFKCDGISLIINSYLFQKI